jgi:2-polyprenyl-6-methoxyphenol hydroxylase-like FAD-dependent oxidoreductase
LLESQVIDTLDENSIVQLLDEYEALRTAEQRSVAGLGDGLVSLFSNNLPVLRQIRAGALALLDIIPPLKAEVVMSGMGFSFSGNPMLRGQVR